jgi:hypothetical protein
VRLQLVEAGARLIARLVTPVERRVDPAGQVVVGPKLVLPVVAERLETQVADPPIGPVDAGLVAEPGEERLLVWIQQVVAPADRRAQRLVAGRLIRAGRHRHSLGRRSEELRVMV